MTLDIRHAFVCPVVDLNDPDKVGPDEWNAALTANMATARVLGRTTAGDGPVEELDAAALATFLTGLYQPLDSDLTAIAGLTTASYGRGLLTLANATALAAEVDSFFLTPSLISINFPFFVVL